MGFVDKVVTVGAIVLFGERVRSARKDAQETQRRKNSPLHFDHGVTRSEFEEIVLNSAKRTPRLEDVDVTGMTVNLRVRSNSGLTSWEAQVDFNDYGHLTGRYWLHSKNPRSLVPEHLADAVRTEVRRRLEVASKSMSVAARAMTSPPGWHLDPYPGSPPYQLRWWDGVLWTEHVAQPHGPERHSDRDFGRPGPPTE